MKAFVDDILDSIETMVIVCESSEIIVRIG